MIQKHILKGIKPFGRRLMLPLLCGALVALHSPEASAALAGGTYSINPSGTASATVYKSLTDAISDMTSGTRSDGGTPNGAGITGAVRFELAAGYTSSGETFPLTFGFIAGNSSTNTITVRPAFSAGTTPLVITSNNAVATIRFAGAARVILDGRRGGSGAIKGIEVVNTNTSGTVISFTDSASYNTVQYCTVRGVANGATGACINFVNTSAATGVNNQILFTDITAGATRPTNGIYAIGSAAGRNVSNRIEDCNISNFANDGIYLSDNNLTYTIRTNSFYQTSPITLAGACHMAGIHIDTGQHSVSSNYIGGSEAQCGGTAWTVTGNYDNTFRGIIWRGVGSTITCSGNRVANIWLESNRNGGTLSTAAFVAIGGIANIVGLSSNYIGSDTGNGSIIVKGYNTDVHCLGISVETVSVASINNTRIGAITTLGNAPADAVHIHGIGIYQTANGSSAASSNIIGSATTPNSIYAAHAATGTQNVLGIFVKSPTTNTNTLNTNVIANVANSVIGQGVIAGIQNDSSGVVMTGNRVYNLKASGNSAVTGLSSGYVPSTTNTISANRVYNLTGKNVLGIYLDAAHTTPGNANANFVYNLFGNAPNGTVAEGIVNRANFLVTNNMIRLGTPADSSGMYPGEMYGIRADGTVSQRYFFNTVYIGGTSANADNSYAFYNGSTGGIDIQNNIFVNARSNSSGTGKHYAMAFANPLPAVNTIDYNLLRASGSGGNAVRLNGTDYAALVNWQAATLKDANSLSADPLFINPEGNTELIDLHLDDNAPVDGKGINIAGVSTDFDAESRSTLTPHDIGADAGHFTPAQWTGNTSNVWTATGNWTNGLVPNNLRSAVIPVGRARYPVITAAATVKSLTVARGAKLTVNSTLNVYGHINNADTIQASGGTIALMKTEQVYLDAGVLFAGNLSISPAGPSTVTMRSGIAYVMGSLSANTSGKLYTNDSVVLVSTATSTAVVPPLGATRFFGKVIVQRYIPGGRRGFRFLAHPFNDSISIADVADDIDITGAGGPPFTTTQTNNPSAFYFDPVLGNSSTTGNNPGWVPFTASSKWGPGQGMRVLVRGAKGEGLNGNSYTPSPATISVSGELNQGNTTITIASGNAGFIQVGNPLQGNVRIGSTIRVGIGSFYMIWNVNQGLNGGYTAYQYLVDNIVLPPMGSFFTQGYGGSSITFPESSKLPAGATPMFKGTSTHHAVELSLEDSTIFWDRLLVSFDSSAMATVDYPDAPKMYNPDMTFYTLSKDDSMLSIDTRPFTDKEVIKLGLYSTINKSFKITVPTYSTPAGTKVYLKDNYLNKTEEITGVGYTYWFATDANAKSWGNERFELLTEVAPVGITTTTPAAANLKMKLAPNPTSNDVNIYCEGMNGKTAVVSIMNIMGAQVACGSTATGHLNVPMQHLPAGMYVVAVQCDGQTITQKLIKK